MKRVSLVYSTLSTVLYIIDWGTARPSPAMAVEARSLQRPSPAPSTPADAARLLEDDHAPRRRPPPQRLEGIVHALERQAGRDHLVEAEETPPVELDVAGHVRAEAVRAHHAPEDRLLAEHDVRARQLDVRARRHDADHDDRAALARHAHRLRIRAGRSVPDWQQP